MSDVGGRSEVGDTIRDGLDATISAKASEGLSARAIAAIQGRPDPDTMPGIGSMNPRGYEQLVGLIQDPNARHLVASLIEHLVEEAKPDTIAPDNKTRFQEIAEGLQQPFTLASKDFKVSDQK